MNKKEFEDFFKDLEPEDIPSVKEDSDKEDLVFSSFFEDETVPVKKERTLEEEKKTQKNKLVFEEEVFAPPPAAEEKPVRKAPAKEEPAAVKKAEPVKSSKAENAKRKKKKRLNTAYNWLLTVVWVSAVLAVSVFIASFALSSINDLVGFSKESREIEITIPEGYTLEQTAELLKEKGVIDEPFTF
ncbi:MAG: hypothetical protein E7489_07955, partial [Ruminococcaceae bacterium]|nr:hypothetical protein [Oscillospiraceae bacterium]